MLINIVASDVLLQLTAAAGYKKPVAYRKAWDHFHWDDALYNLSARCSSTNHNSIAGHRTCVFLSAFYLRVHVN